MDCRWMKEKVVRVLVLEVPTGLRRCQGLAPPRVVWYSSVVGMASQVVWYGMFGMAV